MTLAQRGDALIITRLPAAEMGALALGLARTAEERAVLDALLRGRRVYLPQSALEYKQFRHTAEAGIYLRFTALERALRELGLRRYHGK